MPAPATKTRTALSAAVDQGTFDFLVPFGPHRALLRPDEVSRCLGWKQRTVYQLIDEGKLEAHAIPGRDKQRYQVTRRSVLLFLAETALYHGEDTITRTERLLSSFSAAELSRLIATATRLRATL
jgi:excisionase family DNA binding protein